MSQAMPLGRQSSGQTEEEMWPMEVDGCFDKKSYCMREAAISNFSHVQLKVEEKDIHIRIY